MHQTFYIDIDEEITSIVDRLRKSKSAEVVIVVPKRAILIQSIVNLKLLKKEAESFNKELIIVTQDKLGKMLIEKAGIVVEQKLDDISGWEMEEESSLSTNSEIDIDLDKDIVSGNGGKNTKDFDTIGSDGYYPSEKIDVMPEAIVYSEKRNQDIFQPEEAEASEERILNRELVTDVSEELRKQQPSFRKNKTKGGMFAPMDMVRNIEIVENNSFVAEPMERATRNEPKRNFKQEMLSNLREEAEFKQEDVEEEKIQRASKFFENRKALTSAEDEYRSINVGNNLGKYFIVFTVIAVAAILGAATYLFLPKATIVVFAKNKIQSVDVQVEGSSVASGVDLVNETVPAKAVALADELTKSYEVTGAKDSSNQKAKGTITVYNEFSTSPQPLVATTRFESSDKKIFRLVQAITVPGMEKVGSENKPGAIEAEVVADESGEQYNIAAGTFSIPGFQSSGGDKFAKIYAKSFTAMQGGGSGGGSQKVRTVSDSDVSSAKTKTLQELKLQIMQKLKDSVGAEYIFLDDAVSVDDAVYTLSKSSGDVADNFSITVRAKVNAVVFKESDIKAIVSNSLGKKGERGAKIPENSIKLDFGKADVNMKDSNMVIRVHATGNIVPEIDLERLKSDLLGKKDEDIASYLKGYTQDIEKIEVIHSPAFIAGKIPAYNSRVTVSLDQL